jgi:hypothetical protein
MPGSNLIESDGDRRRRIVDSRMRYDSKEFVQAGPWNRPRGTAFRQLGHAARRRLMKWCILAVRVNQYIGIEGDHPPRPSYARSRILSQSASHNSEANPWPLNVTLRNRNERAAFRSAMILRRPCSTSARRVVRSRAAIFRASCRSGSEISSVVFTCHIPGFYNMGSNINYHRGAASANGRRVSDALRSNCAAAYGHFTRGGIDDRIESTLPPVLRPNTVPRS